MDTLYCYAYLSTIRPEISLTRVYDIVKSSRAFNRQHDITGLLVFDGWRFFQYIEGEESEVRALVERIRCDERHEHFTELLSRPMGGPRHFRNWSMGYAVTADESLLADLVGIDDSRFFERVRDIVSVIDLEP